MALTKTHMGIGVVLVVLLALAAYLYLGKSTSSVAGAQIVSAVASRSVDTHGNATGVTNSFSAKTDKVVYIVLTLKNAKKSSVLSYVRYFNNKYLDSKVASPAADSAQSLDFIFEKGIGNYKPGDYKVVTFINGKRSAEVNYSFK